MIALADGLTLICNVLPSSWHDSIVQPHDRDPDLQAKLIRVPLDSEGN